MENASKALLIAGGILLALLIVSGLIIMVNNVSDLRTAKEQETENNQILAFNAEYEAYNKPYLDGVEIITIMNKAIDNNKRNSSGRMVHRVDIELWHDNNGASEDLPSASTRSKSRSIDKLSSGYKIRRAADDAAAGRALSNEMIYNIRELNSMGYNLWITLDDYESDSNIYIDTIKNTTFRCNGISYGEDGRVNFVLFVELTGAEKGINTGKSPIRDTDM